MNIAERIRVEKRSKVDFNATTFMDIVEKYFQGHEFNAWFHIKENISEPFGDIKDSFDGDFTNSHSDWIGNIKISFNKEKHYHSLDTISVPSEYYDTAIQLLKDEGFYIYSEGKNDKLVSLNGVRSISNGIHSYYREN